METSSSRRLLPILLLLAVSAAYLYTMNPAVSVGDSGEFIAASHTLALPHAPSYPLFTLLGKAFITIIPMGNIAYRVNLVSLLAGAGTGALFFFLAQSSGLGVFVAALSALVFSASQVMWEHSLTSEVFSLNSLIAVLILLSWMGPAEKRSVSVRSAMSGLLLGLGLGNHHTLILVAPGILLFYLLKSSDKNPSRDLAYFIGFFAAGFMIYLFLPIRSHKNPPLDWSNPENLANFIRVITRADYGSLSLTLGEKIPRNLETVFQQAYRYLASISHSLTFAGLLAGILGWIAWWRKDWKACLPFFTVFVISGIGFLLLGNLPFDSQSSGVLPRFFMLPWIPFVLAFAHFLEWVRERARFWTALAALSVLSAVLSGWKDIRIFRNDFASYDYGRNILKTLPQNSVLFMDGGDDTFYSLAYLTMAENRRPDLEIHDRGGLIFRSVYGGDFRSLIKTEKEKRRQTVESSHLGVKRLFYSTFDRNILKGARLENRGILYEAVPAAASPPAGGDTWKFYSLRGVYEIHPHPYRLRALVPLYPFLEGVSRWDMRMLLRAAGFGTDIGWLKSNLIWELSMKGYHDSSEGRLGQAETVFKTILKVDPENSSALTNLGVLASDRGDLGSAESYYKQAVKAEPKNADAHFNYGVLYWKKGQWREVMESFEMTLRYNPDHPSARQYLEAAKRKAMEGRKPAP